MRDVQKSFLGLDSNNMMVEAVKETEDDQGIILRLYEVPKGRGRVRLLLWRESREARSTDLLEAVENSDKLDVSGNEIEVPYLNHQIVTLKLNPNTKPGTHSR